MAFESSIQWTESTWNPWHGCKKVSEGCKFCYMYRDKERYKQDPKTVLKSKTDFNKPLKWKEGRLIFTCSWSDWFIEDADEWRSEAWEIIKKTPQHTYQILTKRPHRIKECLPEDWGTGYENVWLGVSAENQTRFDERVQQLQKIPSKVHFLSIEPIIGKIEIANTWEIEGIDWVIIGGESGNNTGKYRYRPCELFWIENLVKELQDFEVPVFVKQLGTHLATTLKLKDRHGGKIEEFPKNLQIRQFPLY